MLSVLQPANGGTFLLLALVLVCPVSMARMVFEPHPSDSMGEPSCHQERHSPTRKVAQE